jgi:hypothetical protein
MGVPKLLPSFCVLSLRFILSFPPDRYLLPVAFKPNPILKEGG